MSSGGGKAKTPTLLNDNLYHKQFYRVLDILSEGPIYGPVNQKAPLNDVMLNDTPVTDATARLTNRRLMVLTPLSQPLLSTQR